MIASIKNISAKCLDRPINIYAMYLDSFDVGAISFNELANTLSSYVKYMGYTHVLLLDEYIKRGGKLTKQKKLALINTLHKHGIKVIFKVMPKDVTDKNLYVYTLIKRIQDLGIDGLFFEVPFQQYCDKSLMKTLNREIHAEFPEFITIGGHKLTGSCAECNFDYTLDTELFDKTCDYLSCDPYFRRHIQPSLFDKLFTKFSKERIVPLTGQGTSYSLRTTFSSAYGTYQDKLMQKRAIDLLLMTSLGKKLSVMGDEFAGCYASNGELTIDWNILDLSERNDMRSFIRELNLFYLLTPTLWHDDNIEFIACDGGEFDKNVIAYMRTSPDDRLMTVVNLSGIEQSITVNCAEIITPVFATDAYIGDGSICRIDDSFYSITLPAFCGAIYRMK